MASLKDGTIITGTTDSTTKDTGALIVEGGVGVEKNVYVGGRLMVGTHAYTTIDVTAGLVTFTDLQAQVDVIVISGTLATSMDLILPVKARQWTIINQTTIAAGVYDKYVTVKGASGTGFKIRGGTNEVYEAVCDGTNFYAVNGGNGDLTFTSSQTYVTLENLYDVSIGLAGGGGGGGGGGGTSVIIGASAGGSGGGGGGGGYVGNIIYPYISRGSSLDLLIGANGTGGIKGNGINFSAPSAAAVAATAGGAGGKSSIKKSGINLAFFASGGGGGGGGGNHVKLLTGTTYAGGGGGGGAGSFVNLAVEETAGKGANSLENPSGYYGTDGGGGGGSNGTASGVTGGTGSFSGGNGGAKIQFISGDTPANIGSDGSGSGYGGGGGGGGYFPAITSGRSGKGGDGGGNGHGHGGASIVYNTTSNGNNGGDATALSGGGGGGGGGSHNCNSAYNFGGDGGDGSAGFISLIW